MAIDVRCQCSMKKFSLVVVRCSIPLTTSSLVVAKVYRWFSCNLVLDAGMYMLVVNAHMQ